MPIFIDRGAPNCYHSIQNSEQSRCFQRRLLADCVEEVRKLAILDRTMQPPHGRLIVPKRAGAQGSGSALRASGGSGPWQPAQRELPVAHDIDDKISTNAESPLTR